MFVSYFTVSCCISAKGDRNGIYSYYVFIICLLLNDYVQNILLKLEVFVFYTAY